MTGAARRRALFRATRASTRPARNTAGPASRPGAGPYRSHRRPPSTVLTTLAARNAVNGHEYSAPPCSSVTIVGSAVPTLIASNASNVISRISPADAARRSGAHSALVTYPACNLNPGRDPARVRAVTAFGPRPTEAPAAPGKGGSGGGG